MKPDVSKAIAGACFMAFILCVQAVDARSGESIRENRMKTGETLMENGLRHRQVAGDVDSVWNRLLSVLEAMKAPVFSKIDHKANAGSVGLDMKEARVVSFGHPAVGTLLMQRNPETALDLPLKILVWESPDGTMLSWNDPDWIAMRHGLGQNDKTVEKMTRMLDTIVTKVAGEHESRANSPK